MNDKIISFKIIAIFLLLDISGFSLKVHPILFYALKGIHFKFRGLSENNMLLFLGQLYKTNDI